MKFFMILLACATYVTVASAAITYSLPSVSAPTTSCTEEYSSASEELTTTLTTRTTITDSSVTGTITITLISSDSSSSENSPITASSVSGAATNDMTLSDCNSTTVVPTLGASSVVTTESITKTVIPIPVQSSSYTSNAVVSVGSPTFSNDAISATSKASSVSPIVASTVTYAPIYPTGSYTSAAASIVTAPMPANLTTTLPVGNATMTIQRSTTTANSGLGSSSSVAPITGGAAERQQSMVGGLLGSIFLVFAALI